MDNYKKYFLHSFCCGFWSKPWFSKALVIDSLRKLWNVWVNSYTTSSYSLPALVRFLICRGGPGGPQFARESTVWTRSEGSLFPFLLSLTFIVCGCFVKFLCTSVKHSSPSILFLIKSSGGDRWRGGKKACLVLARGPRALLWEAAWMVNGGRSHSGGDDTHSYKGMRYCNAHWCQNVKLKVCCPFGQLERWLRWQDERRAV